MNVKIIDFGGIDIYGVFGKCFSGEENRYSFARTMWDENELNTPAEICSGYDGIWYGVWSADGYFIGRDKSNCTSRSLEKMSIPKGKYAVFTTEKGGYAGDELPKLHNQIINSWLPSSGFTLDGNIEIEVYHLCTDRAERRKKRYYEIWIPIKEKKFSEPDTLVSVKNAAPADASQIAKICAEDLGYFCTAELVKTKLSAIDNEREAVFAAYSGSALLGFIHIEKYSVLYLEDGSNILGLAVGKKYRRQGVGSLLLCAAEEWAVKNSSAFVRLNSGFSRKDAHNFYRHNGYDNEKNQIRFMKKL